VGSCEVGSPHVSDRLTSVTSVLAAPPQWMTRLDRLHLLTPLRILLIVAVAVLVTVVLRAAISRLLRRTVGAGTGDRVKNEARQRALASAMRSALVGVVWAAAVITVIGELGVNLGGVIAAATVIGGAVAFGAQTLTRDVIAGFFVLAEDQYGVGDEVDLGHAAGKVERITLRSVRLRDPEGRVWHVPHGGVARSANLSKAGMAHLDLEVSRSSTVADVLRAGENLCTALAADEQIAPLLAGTPTVDGLTDVRDDRLVVRIQVATTPGSRDQVRRVWRTLALDAFARGELVAPPAPSTVVHLAGPAGSGLD
jgi:moderate conductance mechanosensitive channel